MTFDVVIVGAGPAGCAAAIRAASHGLTTALVERARFPRDVPGEALHPDVDGLFDDLGVGDEVSKAGFIRYPGWLLVRAGERTFMPFADGAGFRFGYQAWRSQLDSILLSKAQRTGVTILQPSGRCEPLQSSGRVTGVQVGEQRLSCRSVIDASGTSRWLSRKLGLHVERLSPKLVAEYGYTSEDCDLGTMPEFHEHPCGWTWLARTRPDYYQCVRLSLGEGPDLPALPAPFDRLIKLRGADVTWRFVPDCAGDGYFLCGDAAATLDPAASSGVARALAAGARAADLIASAHARDATEQDAAHAYREWVSRDVASQSLQLASRYAGLEHPPQWLDAVIEAWRRHQSLIECT